MIGRWSRVDIELQLSRWTKEGKLIQLRRGWYVLAEPYRKVSPHPFLLANKMKKASYISLQSALSYYGLIPEYVPLTTSVTTGRPERVETAEGVFIYRHIKGELFNAYEQVDVSDKQSIFIASPAKSLFDLIYLTPGGDTWDYLKGLRLQNMELIDIHEAKEIFHACNSPKMKRAVARVIQIIEKGEGECIEL